MQLYASFSSSARANCPAISECGVRHHGKAYDIRARPGSLDVETFDDQLGPGIPIPSPPRAHRRYKHRQTLRHRHCHMGGIEFIGHAEDEVDGAEPGVRACFEEASGRSSVALRAGPLERVVVRRIEEEDESCVECRGM